MGRKKKFIDKKKSATFQLIARDSSDPIYDDSPGNDRVFVRIDNNPVSVFEGSGEYEDKGEGDSDSIFADAPEDNNDNEADDRVFGTPAAGPARKPLLENVRKEILELGFPDDGYNYLKHLREIKNTGGGSAYYQNPKAKLEELPRDVKAYDASRVRISEGDADSNEKSIFSVASKTVGVRLQKAVDPEVAALLDDSDLSRFASDDEDLEEDFVVQANFAEEGEEDEDEEVDNRLNIVEEKPENEVDKAGASGQQEVVDSLVFRNGVGNQLVKEGDEIVGDKPRAPRLLDEQFDLLERKEYGTDDDEDDDDYVYVAEEDEFLAEKLKHTLGDNLIDDLELDGKYRAPADLLRDTEGPKSKELLETAADVIHRIVEYAEKYEIESENEDKDMILEQESSDESEMWDCETIVSTYTNCDNHPVKIGAPITRKKKLAETVSNARGATSHVISLQGKQKLPVDFIPPSRKPAAEKVKDVGSNKVEQKKRKPNGQESKEEKKERKAAVKEERREARCVKKEMKELYRSEAQRAQKVAAVACPSSIHLIWGGSSRPDFTCKSTEEIETWFIDSFEEWRKAKNLSNFILLGHSFGGYVAAKYALKQPEHVQHLILVGPAGFSSDSDPKYETLIRFRATWKGAILNHLWESNFTPMKVVRGLGPWGPNIVRKYTSARYGTYATGNTLTEEESRLLTDYVYHTLAAKGSGELCLKYIFSFGAFTRMPLLNSASEWKVPTTFIYGFQDWMNYEGAMEARKQMKVPCEIIRVPQAGHFVFIDNPNGFHSAVLHACRKFLSPDPDSDFDSLPEGLTSA